MSIEAYWFIAFNRQLTFSQPSTICFVVTLVAWLITYEVWPVFTCSKDVLKYAVPVVMPERWLLKLHDSSKSEKVNEDDGETTE